MNILWYVGLAIIGVVITVYTIYKKKDTYRVSTLLAFYMFSAGAGWLGEFVVLGVFNSYAYRTGVFLDPWAQNLLAHLILNTSLYPSIAVIMMAYNLRYRWMIICAAVFVSIEILFVRLSLYEHHWWKYYMTAITVIVFLLISYIWLHKLVQKPYGLRRTVTYYFIALLIIHIPAPILLLMGKSHYTLSFVDKIANNYYLSSIIITFSYHVIESLIIVVLVCVAKKWYWKLVPFIVSIIVQSILAKLNILITAKNWSLIYTIVIYEVFIALFIVVESYTLKSKTRIR